MHILVVNDDGPPSTKSPYIRHLVSGLKIAGHTVSVVLPDGQRSWIGKAHLINDLIRCTPSQKPDEKGWLFVNSTPAACVHVGLRHSSLDRGPIDLVISGPNFGFNASALFALSSGTLGAAFEATLCRKRAIALSYNQFANPCPEAIDATVRYSIKIIEALVKQWPEEEENLLYSVNMAVAPNAMDRKIIWTEPLSNFWGDGGAFVEAGAPSGTVDLSTQGPPGTFHLKWAPDLNYWSRKSPAEQFKEDVAVLEEGNVSITAFRANFATAARASLHAGTQFVL